VLCCFPCDAEIVFNHLAQLTIGLDEGRLLQNVFDCFVRIGSAVCVLLCGQSMRIVEHEDGAAII